MKNKLWLIITLLFLPLLCFAGTTIYEYKIHYAGLPVAYVTITAESTDSLQTITLESTSKGLVSALFPVENTYVSSCNNKYQPYYFWKTIYQQNVEEKKVVLFDRKKENIVIRDVMNKQIDTLSYNASVYDIISMTFSLLNEMPEQQSYTCYGNYRIWNLAAERTKTTDFVFQKEKYPCYEYRITSEIECDSTIDSKTDILTNNIYKYKGMTQYWITKEAPHLLLKAKYKRFPFSIYLLLTNISTQ